MGPVSAGHGRGHTLVIQELSIEIYLDLVVLGRHHRRFRINEAMAL